MTNRAVPSQPSTRFDRIVIVDWSAANTPKTGGDSIWIADTQAATYNPATRTEAIAHIEAIIAQALARSDRLLIGWDFAFGYPAGFAKSLGWDSWADIWAWLYDAVEDGADNRSNRFEVAAALNRRLGPENGPFWGYVGRSCPDGLSPKQYPSGRKTPWGFSAFNYLRQVETYVPRASPVFKLAYTGSVGSQSLLGIARLEGLRRIFKDQIAIWPFETEFAANMSVPIICAEIYPSAHIVPDGPTVKDQRQVEAVLRDFSAWNEADTLRRQMNASGLDGLNRKIVQGEEGWIIGL